MAKLTANAKKLLDGKNFAHVATLMPDGSPQVTPVWVDHDGERVLVNTAMGRVKQLNTERDPRVALSICDHNNPYTKLLIRGRVVEQTLRGAVEHIHKLSRKYDGRDFTLQPNQIRVILKIEPAHVTG